jgi:glutathione-specific gamma-glutamylcyclotransferase
MSHETDIGISRQGLEQGQLRAMVAAAGYGHLLLSDAEIEASLASVRRPGATWVFAYGSLMWNPVFDPVERVPGRLHGWHRRFCFWVHAGRGSPERPGLMMGLLPGGACRGVLLRIAEHEADRELNLLWHREMVTSAYVPRRMPVATADGPVEAIVFVANRRHPHYVGGLSAPQAAEHLTHAEGPLGRNRDYLSRTVLTLRSLGIPDRGLERLCAEVRARV